MSNEYVALIGYGSVAFIVFIGGLVWQKHRQHLGRKLRLKNYREEENHNPVNHDQPHAMSHH